MPRLQLANLASTAGTHNDKQKEARMQKKYKNRLLRLADKMLGEGPYEKAGPVPEHKFNIRCYFSVSSTSGCGIERSQFNSLKCNTAACGIGWALVDSWFASRGLSFANSTMSFFGITYVEEHYLFFPESYSDRYPTASQLAKKLQEVVKEQPDTPAHS